MQLNPSYLYSNKMDVYSELGTWTAERYRKMYQRNFKVYRGVDNRLDFQVRNGDQKPQDMSGKTVVFNLFTTETKEFIITKNCDVQSYTGGKFYIVLSEAFVQKLGNGYYTFSLHSIDALGVKTALYGDTQYGATGIVEVVGSTFAEPYNSIVETEFTIKNGDLVTKNDIDAKPQLKENSVLHTVALYGKDYVGVATIQGSLDSYTPASNWIDLATLNFNQDPLKYQNIEGIWSWFRIKLNSTSGSLDKILYRY